MHTVLYTVTTDGESRVYSNPRKVRLDGSSGPLAAYVAKNAKGKCPCTWSLDGSELAKELGADTSQEKLVFDELPECTDERTLSAVLKIAGYSHEARTFIGMLLAYLCDENKGGPGNNKERLVCEKPGWLHVAFLRLEGGVGGGTWKGREVDGSRIASDGPDAYAFLKRELGCL